MAEPLFFDCLTEAQLWSLFAAGVLQGYQLPVEAYERLLQIAPTHGCFPFTWPASMDLPSLRDLVPDSAMPSEGPPLPTSSNRQESPVPVAWVRSEIEAFCARMNSDMPREGRRVHTIWTNPTLELRAGPYIGPHEPDMAPQGRELHAMSLPDIEAYLDEVLRVDEGLSDYE